MVTFTTGLRTALTQHNMNLKCC